MGRGGIAEANWTVIEPPSPDTGLRAAHESAKAFRPRGAADARPAKERSLHSRLGGESVMFLVGLFKIAVQQVTRNDSFEKRPFRRPS
jgi:hypothetical protein